MNPSSFLFLAAAITRGGSLQTMMQKKPSPSAWSGNVLLLPVSDFVLSTALSFATIFGKRFVDLMTTPKKLPSCLLKSNQSIGRICACRQKLNKADLFG